MNAAVTRIKAKEIESFCDGTIKLSGVVRVISASLSRLDLKKSLTDVGGFGPENRIEQVV